MQLNTMCKQGLKLLINLETKQATVFMDGLLNHSEMQIHSVMKHL